MTKMISNLILLAAMTCWSGTDAGGSGGAAVPFDYTVVKRRLDVLGEGQRGAAGIPALTNALEDENLLVRRAAARTLAEMGPPANDALKLALNNEDALVRRTALAALIRAGGAPVLQYFEKALGDADVTIREDAVKRLAALQPRTEPIATLLRRAQADEAVEVRAPALAALWPFHKESVLLRDRPDLADHVSRVVVERRLELPREGWRFKPDRKLDGHLRKWFKPGLNEAAWDTIAIGYWKDQYLGVAWQRVWFDLPAQPADGAAVELVFGAVDESAWVWLNGEYVGQHDLGPEGFNQEFRLDATREVKWGGRNQLTVRVLNTELGGGIWKPVSVEVLKIK